MVFVGNLSRLTNDMTLWKVCVFIVSLFFCLLLGLMLVTHCVLLLVGEDSDILGARCVDSLSLGNLRLGV